MRALAVLLLSAFMAMGQTCSPQCSSSGPYTECCLRNMLAAQTAKAAVVRINTRHIALPWSAGLDSMIRSIGASNKWSAAEVVSVVAVARASSGAFPLSRIEEKPEPKNKSEPPQKENEPPRPVVKPPEPDPPTAITRAPTTLPTPAGPCDPDCSAQGPYTECCLRNMLAAQIPHGAVQRINSRHIAAPWSVRLEGTIRSMGVSNKWSAEEIASVVAAARASSSALQLPGSAEKPQPTTKNEPAEPIVN